MPAITRDTTNVLLPPEVSAEIWAKTLESSAVMQLAQRRTLPGAGQEFQTITGEPEAQWVNEAADKPISGHTLGTESWKGYTMAFIIPFSNQFRRDKEGLYAEMIDRAPSALGAKLDATVFGGVDVPGELFDTLVDATAVDIETNPWNGLVTASTLIATEKGQLTGFALSPLGESLLLTAVDNNNRPLFINSMNTDDGVSRILGRPVYIKDGVAADGTPVQYGYAGDWRSAYYGVVDDITVSISDQATLNIDGESVNLWQRDMFAVRFEFEVGFKAKYKEHFVRLVGKSE